MAINKVEYGGKTLIDLTEDTVTPETLVEGETAHDASGNRITGTLNLGNYQTKEDNNLETESKEVVGAINEVNSKTIDKINYLNFQSGNNEIFSCNEEGIGYENEYEIETVDGYYHYGSVDNRIPIVAGENVTFEIDEASQVVKINATGGGSNDSVVGTWVFKDVIERPNKNFEVSFTCNGNKYVAIETSDAIYYSVVVDDETDPAYSLLQNRWYEGYQTITITEQPTDTEFIEWLKANAEKSTLNEADKQVIIQTVLSSIPFAEGVGF